MSVSSELVNALLDERSRIEGEIEQLEERLSHIKGLLDENEEEDTGHDFTYEIKSESNPNEYYTVTWHGNGGYSCECADYMFRSNGDDTYKCKHIKKMLRDTIHPDVRNAVNRWGT